jgi:hypothetical protein
LTDEEKTSFERQFFENDEAFDRLLEAEDDLVDALVRGELEGGVRAAFEKRVLESPRLRERVHFARALAAVPLNGSRSRRPIVALAVAASILLAAGGTWALLESQRLRRQHVELVAESGRLRDELARLLESSRADRSRLEDSLRNLAPSQAATPAGRVLSFALAGGLTRGNTGANRLVVSKETETIVFELPIGAEDQGRYRVTIETAEGRKVAVLDGVSRAPGPTKKLRVSFPGSLLGSGDYILGVAASRVASGQPPSEFAFRVVRE